MRPSREDRVSVKETQRGFIGHPSEGRHQNSPQQDDKNMLGKIGDLFYEMYATSHKRPFVLYVGEYLLSDYYVMYGHRAQSVF